MGFSTCQVDIIADGCTMTSEHDYWYAVKILCSYKYIIISKRERKWALSAHAVGMEVLLSRTDNPAGYEPTTTPLYSESLVRFACGDVASNEREIKEAWDDFNRLILYALP